MMKNFLFTEGLDKTKEDIIKLNATRQRNFRTLEDYREGVEKMIKKKPNITKLAEAISDFSGNEMEIYLVKWWLSSEGNKLEIDDNLLLSAVKLPEKVTDAIALARKCIGITQDAKRYWDVKTSSFVNLPVNEEEQKQIRRRNHRYTETEEDTEMVKFAENLVRFINFSNKKFQKSIEIGDINDSPLKGLIPALSIEGRFGHGGKQFAFNKEIFLLPPFLYRAFDE